MAFNKKNKFPETDQHVAQIAKALSHPARIAILKELAERRTCICGEIVGVLPLSQSTVSQHLRELKQTGIIKGTADGTRSCYCIDWEVLNRYRDSLTSFLANLQNVDEIAECC
jgi:ArsR family transcriptional regulator